MKQKRVPECDAPQGRLNGYEPVCQGVIGNRCTRDPRWSTWALGRPWQTGLFRKRRRRRRLNETSGDILVSDPLFSKWSITSGGGSETKTPPKSALRGKWSGSPEGACFFDLFTSVKTPQKSDLRGKWSGRPEGACFFTCSRLFFGLFYSCFTF